MAFKLAKGEIKQFEDLKRKVEAAYSKVETTVQDANTELETIAASVNTAITEHNAALSELTAYIEAKAEAWRSEFDDKSEAWQESDRASSANEFIEAWEEAGIEPLEEIALEDIETPESVIDGINELPMEAEG